MSRLGLCVWRVQANKAAAEKATEAAAKEAEKAAPAPTPAATDGWGADFLAVSETHSGHSPRGRLVGSWPCLLPAAAQRLG